MSPGQRCDEILRILDEALCEDGDRPARGLGDATADLALRGAVVGLATGTRHAGAVHRGVSERHDRHVPGQLAESGYAVSPRSACGTHESWGPMA